MSSQPLKERGMIVKWPGKYKLLCDFQYRTAFSTGTLPAGMVIKVTQVDKETKKVTGPELHGWHYWDLPVVRY